MKKIFACILLLLASIGIIGTVNVPPTSAYLTTCSVAQYGPYVGGAICYNTVNNGGLNYVRLQYRCRNAANTWVTGYFYAQWTPEDVMSSGSCYGRTLYGVRVDYIFQLDYLLI